MRVSVRELLFGGSLAVAVVGCDGRSPLDKETDPGPESPVEAVLAAPTSPAVEGSVRLEQVWGDGVEVDVQELRWAGPGELAFRLGLTDTRSGEAVAEVDAADLRFSEDGVPLGREALFTVERAKDLRVVLVLDLSRSIADVDALDPLRRAARTLVETLPREARVAVVGFATGHELLADFSDASQVMGVLEALSPPEGVDGRFTNLWGAVARAAALVGGREEGAGAVVLFTDGRDNVAEVTESQAAAALATADVTVYAVGLGEDVDSASLTGIAGTGRYLSTTAPAALEAAFEDIGRRLGERLLVRYLTPKRAGRHDLDVEIDLGDRLGGFSATFTLP